MSFFLIMKKVINFYKDNPFNYSDDINIYLESIKNSNQVIEYEDLHKLLSNNYGLGKNKKDIIEFGFGTGWLTNTISYHYKKKVHAVDFTKKAIETAQEVSNSLKVYPRYTFSNIFSFEDPNLYDLVISLGVLHHIPDTQKALLGCTSKLKKGAPLKGPKGFYKNPPLAWDAKERSNDNCVAFLQFPNNVTF